MTKKSLAVVGLSVAALACSYFYAVAPHHSWADPESAQGLLDKADALSWTNRWAAAAPLYARALTLFQKENRPAKALYAEVSELPVDESISAAAKIRRLDDALATETAGSSKLCPIAPI